MKQSSSLVLFAGFVGSMLIGSPALAQPLVPAPEPPASEGEPIKEADRTRIENMLEKYAASKLKGITAQQQARQRLVPGIDPYTNEPLPNDEGPHELGFHAQLPKEEEAFELQLLSAETLGKRRYRLAISLGFPLTSIGGFYKFDGAPRLFRRPIGWVVEEVSAAILVRATIDVGWKSLDNGNLGIYPGGFIDESLTEEQRQQARLIEELLIDVGNVDLSRLDLTGINGKPMVRQGIGVGRGGLLRAIGAGGRVQIEQMIEQGVNQLIRQNELKLLEGLNTSLQSELPDTQIQVESFIEKLAIQANLPGKELPKPAPSTPEPNDEEPLPVEPTEE